VGNYAACHHDVEAPIDQDNNGVMFLNSAVPIRDISDGTTHTIFVGEKAIEEDDLGWMSGTRATLRNTGGNPNLNMPVRGAIDGGPAQAAGDPLLYVGGFSSYHPGGAQFMIGDGSVRFISETIDQLVYQQLGNRADGKLMQSRF
jgi:hypothetical protein